MDKEKVVLFYPTGIVHFRNLEILKKHLPGFRFRVVVEPWVKEKAPEALDRIYHKDTVFTEDGVVPDPVWEDTHILFLSMAYPNPFRLHMVYEAAKRGIPVTAIEEVNQLALNDGIINHYFLPLDQLGVPSQVEKDRFMDLGLTEESVQVTGWPFFNEEAALKSDGCSAIRKQYNIPANKKCCLLVLGSLKERDMVSLESSRVRKRILEIVSKGLPSDYQLLIKPHPIETEAALTDIRLQVPDAVILGPKHPIEPLLVHSSLVINRGNSQVTLLALMKQKPVVIVPVGLRTVFHGVMDSVIADSPEQFASVVDFYRQGLLDNYKPVLDSHFPVTRAGALDRVKQLFTTAAGTPPPPLSDTAGKMLYISMLYAFLGDLSKAERIAGTIMKLAPDDPAAPLLTLLYHEKIEPADFSRLLELFPGKILRWHLQALYIRLLIHNTPKGDMVQAVKLLAGFDGDVNPHYFIDDLVKRIELELIAGNRDTAEALMEKFREDYGVFDYYNQAFNMLDYVYRKHSGTGLWKNLWLLKNLNKGYSRKYIKTKLGL